MSKIHFSDTKAQREEARTRRPEVGAILSFVPSHCRGDNDLCRTPLPCVVLAVNDRGRFFTVRFQDTGLCESFPYGA